MKVRVKAYAKLNLTLDITGVEGGYHMLDSLVCSVDLYDLIVLNKRKDDRVSIEMHGCDCELIPYENNNAVKAAERYIAEFGTCGADIVIYKNIPVGAGLGGSSADAAGVLRGMAELYGKGGENQLKEIADSLGSDTGYMLNGGFAVLRGKGERVEKIKRPLKLHFILLKPRGGVSTSECYALYDRLSCGTGGNSFAAVEAITKGDVQALGKSLHNALYEPAVRLNPDVKTAFEELEAFSPLGVCMTGSGSAVFALFENAEFCAWAKSRYRGKFNCIQLKSVTK